MRSHLTGEEVERLRRRELPEEEVASVLRHIGECPACAALVSGDSAADAARVEEILAAEAAEPLQHLAEDELFGWVDGALDPPSRLAVEQHLGECGLCRDEAADLQRLIDRSPARPRRRWMWIAAAAAAGVLIAILLLSRGGRMTPEPQIVHEPPRREAPPHRREPNPQPYAKAEWGRLVDEVLAAGGLPFPAGLSLLHRGTEPLRGPHGDAPERLEPSGMVIDTTVPELTWPPRKDATYAVTIFEGETPVAHSPALHTARWTPDRPLRRGRTFTWQVEVQTGGTTELLPAPPAPPAIFRVAGTGDHEDIAAARARHPDDHLLLASLYARAGMEAEAKDEVRRIPASSDPRIERLRANVLKSETRR